MPKKPAFMSACNLAFPEIYKFGKLLQAFVAICLFIINKRAPPRCLTDCCGFGE